jgi:ribosomal protein S18 acetylase RimI-like enzyme
MTKKAFEIIAINSEYCDEDDDYPYEEFMDEATKLARARNIGITSDRNVVFVAINESNEVVGAAWKSDDNDNYTFDVVVDANHEKKGIGSALTDLMISQRSELLEVFEDSTMLVHVVSQDMQKLLARRGFVVTQFMGDSNLIMGLATEHKAVRVPAALIDDDSLSL